MNMALSLLRLKIYSLALAALIIFFLLNGCTFLRGSKAALQSTDHFLVSLDDPRILYEPGAEHHAEIIASFLPEAIQKVEEKQYRSFSSPVQVYICSSRESFTKMFGSDVRAGVLAKLFLSPWVFEESEEVLNMYLMHELSHLLLLEQLGTYKMRRLPFWFKEGVATYVSEGGGAQKVSEEEAKRFILEGKYFVPNETGGLIFQNTPSDWDLKPQMFYRQSEIFIKYLLIVDEKAFKQMLLSAQEGENLSSALENSYQKNLETLWKGFLLEMINEG